MPSPSSETVSRIRPSCENVADWTFKLTASIAKCSPTTLQSLVVKDSSGRSVSIASHQSDRRSARVRRQECCFIHHGLASAEHLPSSPCDQHLSAVTILQIPGSRAWHSSGNPSGKHQSTAFLCPTQGQHGNTIAAHQILSGLTIFSPCHRRTRSAATQQCHLCTPQKLWLHADPVIICFPLKKSQQLGRLPRSTLRPRGAHAKQRRLNQKDCVAINKA